MKKKNRQNLILDIINKVEVKTQEDLVERLIENGINATQATISRDIKELALIKIPSGNGGSKYSTTRNVNVKNVNIRLNTVLEQSVISVKCANNLIVIKTLSGMANAAAAVIDGMNKSELLGTIAGDDTILLVVDSTKNATKLCSYISDIIKNR